jgi:hypothetical protein
MSEPEDPGSCCGKGHQEQDSLLQSEYDGSLSVGLGKHL